MPFVYRDREVLAFPFFNEDVMAVFSVIEHPSCPLKGAQMLDGWGARQFRHTTRLGELAYQWEEKGPV